MYTTVEIRGTICLPSLVRSEIGLDRTVMVVSHTRQTFRAVGNVVSGMASSNCHCVSKTALLFLHHMCFTHILYFVISSAVDNCK